MICSSRRQTWGSFTLASSGTRAVQLWQHGLQYGLYRGSQVDLLALKRALLWLHCSGTWARFDLACSDTSSWAAVTSCDCYTDIWLEAHIPHMSCSWGSTVLCHFKCMDCGRASLSLNCIHFPSTFSILFTHVQNIWSSLRTSGTRTSESEGKQAKEQLSQGHI